MTNRDVAIKGAIESQTHFYGLLDEALEMNEAHVEAAIKTVGSIVDAGTQYLLCLYELQRLHIEWDDVLEYAENGE